MGGKTSSASKNKYNAKAYDRINFVVPKGQKSIIQAAAQKSGESVNSYISRAVRLQLEKDGFPLSPLPSPDQQE